MAGAYDNLVGDKTPGGGVTARRAASAATARARAQPAMPLNFATPEKEEAQPAMPLNFATPEKEEEEDVAPFLGLE